jgi:hypothetical protein
MLGTEAADGDDTLDLSPPDQLRNDHGVSEHRKHLLENTIFRPVVLFSGMNGGHNHLVLKARKPLRQPAWALF